MLDGKELTTRITRGRHEKNGCFVLCACDARVDSVVVVFFARNSVSVFYNSKRFTLVPTDYIRPIRKEHA